MTTDFDDEQFEQVAQSLERWLGGQATDEVPELVLVGLLRGYADAIEEHGYVPRSWHDRVQRANLPDVPHTESNS
ncbi:hypothetical protein SAMN05216559_2307 [Halomicrobium zhouii]|uniref:Uncharacterized protein n=1 Tax=Halomicrobium zhouii TaxID=767519 RepID=A0A1I6L9C4_9EURY|nr:hypothetical protein [Halomicrobium zhouii]SFS00085.1 hypothetical protein SAMN05216559_2307 [Halomicrobium zhouii]